MLNLHKKLDFTYENKENIVKPNVEKIRDIVKNYEKDNLAKPDLDVIKDIVKHYWYDIEDMNYKYDAKNNDLFEFGNPSQGKFDLNYIKRIDKNYHFFQDKDNNFLLSIKLKPTDFFPFWSRSVNYKFEDAYDEVVNSLFVSLLRTLNIIQIQDSRFKESTSLKAKNIDPITSKTFKLSQMYKPSMDIKGNIYFIYHEDDNLTLYCCDYYGHVLWNKDILKISKLEKNAQINTEIIQATYINNQIYLFESYTHTLYCIQDADSKESVK